MEPCLVTQLMAVKTLVVFPSFVCWHHTKCCPQVQLSSYHSDETSGTYYAFSYYLPPYPLSFFATTERCTSSDSNRNLAVMNFFQITSGTVLPCGWPVAVEITFPWHCRSNSCLGAEKLPSIVSWQVWHTPTPFSCHGDLVTTAGNPW